MHVWFDPPGECRGAVAGIAGGGGDWLLLLSDIAAHGNFVVCGGISYGVGLGRDVFLFGAGQRDDVSGTSAEVVVPRAALAYRRSGWAGGQRAVLCGDWGGVGGVRENVSGSE